jgi:Aspartyl/Asparaginyl beta-hydroxylase
MRDPLALKNFRRCKAAIDTRPFLAEVAAMETLWFANTGRQSEIPAQRETSSIFLRSADRRACPQQNINDIQECVTTPYAIHCPSIMRFLGDFSRESRASLQRALIVRLKPNGRVYPHIDKGLYYKLRDRYHFVLMSLAGSRLSSGNETVVMQQGEVWWFQNKLIHEAQNDSCDWRVHVIFDLLPYTI